MYITKLQATGKNVTVTLNGKQVVDWVSACDEFQRGYVDVRRFEQTGKDAWSWVEHRKFGEVCIEFGMPLPSAHKGWSALDDCDGNHIPGLEQDLDW